MSEWRELDSIDTEILQRRMAAREKLEGPRVGDFVIMPDGTRRRFTWKHAHGIQTTYVWKSGPDAGKSTDTSFGFNDDHGGLDFSGSLDNAIPYSSLELVEGETVNGVVWFFHHNHWKAHNGVFAYIPCRLYRVKVAQADETPHGEGGPGSDSYFSMRD